MATPERREHEMTKYTDTHKSWEAEQREELIAEAKSNIIRLENKKVLAFVKFNWHDYDSNAKYCKIRAYIRHYDRQIARELAFLESEGVRVESTPTFW